MRLLHLVLICVGTDLATTVISRLSPGVERCGAAQPPSAARRFRLADQHRNSVAFSDLLDDFFAECDEHLADARQALLALEREAGRQPNRATLDTLFRAFHSLKGIAGMVGLAAAEQQAHQLEERLRLLRDEQQALTPATLAALESDARRLEQTIAAFQNGAEAPAELVAAQPPALAADDPAEQLWRVIFTPAPALAQRGVDINSVRERLGSFGTIVEARPLVQPGAGLRFEFVLRAPTGLGAQASQAGWAGDGLLVAAANALPAGRDGQAEPAAKATLAPANTVRIGLERLDELMHMVGELVISRARLAQQIEQAAASLPVPAARALAETNQLIERQLRDLRAGVLRARMVPIEATFARLRFVVRDLARQLGKQVQIELDGGATEIDKFVVERLHDPLLHLVRNAASHGIEPAGERLASGKPATGRLRLSASAAGELVTITVADDGQGIDTARVAERARARGLIGPDELLDDARLLRVLCAPGFSTRDTADPISGRGVGLDAVMLAVRELGGALTLTNQPGQGACFRLELPLTLAIIDALIVRVSGQAFAAPLAPVREVLQFRRDELIAIERGLLLRWRGGALPLVWLARRFGLPDSGGKQLSALVIGEGAGAAGLVVDTIAQKREVVVRPIADRLARTPGIAGATELGDGRVVLILDAQALLEHA